MNEEPYIPPQFRDLIFDAMTVLGSTACRDGRHDWEIDGVRACPTGAPDCGQSVYVCRTCGVIDYGYDGGPGRRDCKSICGETMDAWKNEVFNLEGPWRRWP